MVRPSLAFRSAAVLALALAGISVAASPNGRPSTAQQRWQVSTAPLALPLAHRARVALVQAFPGAPRFPVEVRFRDLRGNLLARSEGVVGGGQAITAAVDRTTAPVEGPVLVRAELVIGPIQGAQQVPQSCPLHLTLQTVEGDTDDGAALGCGIDPCLDLQPGPPPRSSVFANCTSARLSVGPAGPNP